MHNPLNPPRGYQTFSQESSQNKPNQPREWNKGLFDCFENPSTCLFTYCCHCFQYAKINSKFTKKDNFSSDCLIYSAIHVFLAPCFPIFMGKFREDVRDKYHINGSFCNDCLTHCCCHCCALIQETNEIEFRENNNSN